MRQDGEGSVRRQANVTRVAALACALLAACGTTGLTGEPDSTVDPVVEDPGAEDLRISEYGIAGRDTSYGFEVCFARVGYCV
jgi:hypothetical protein